jgi:diguanylate cyclase (GGDEF)-like protein
MPAWLKTNLKVVFVPGGVMLGAAALLLSTSWIPLGGSGANFFYYAVFVAALALALRFRYFRVVWCALLLLLSHYALRGAAQGWFGGHAPEKFAFEVIALLVPLNLLLLNLVSERALDRNSLIGIGVVLFFESTFVVVFSRPEQTLSLFHFSLVHTYRLKLPQPALAMFAVVLAVSFVRIIRSHRPIEHGIFWALLATAIGMEHGAVGRLGTAYFGVAGLILASAVIENSYSLAYRDELTGLSSRRAFNDTVLGLKPPYAVAVVDIDHFKSINDTYGHDTGDQVLRMVASRLAEVSGGGQPFRVGGEEFNLLFPGKSAKEVFDHVELLRMNVESCSFRLRGGADRRKTPRETERRADTGTKQKTPAQTLPGLLSVTVSIGVADSQLGSTVAQVIEYADKALYAAKQGGRNRIEVASAALPKKRKKVARMPKPTEV